MPYDGSWWKRGGGCCLPLSLRSLRQSSSRRRYMPHEYFGRPEAASGNQRGEEFRVGQGWACGSGSLSAHIRLVGIVEVVVPHPTIPPNVSCCPWTSHEVARGGIPPLRSVSRWNRGFECRASRIAVRHVFPAAMNNGGGIWLIRMLPMEKIGWKKK